MTQKVIFQDLHNFLIVCGVAVCFWIFQQNLPFFLRDNFRLIALVFFAIGLVFLYSNKNVSPSFGLGVIAMSCGLLSPVQLNNTTIMSAILAVLITIIVSMVATIKPAFNNAWRHILVSLILAIIACLFLISFNFLNFGLIFFLFLFLSYTWGMALNNNIEGYCPIFITAYMFAVTVGFFCLQNSNTIIATLNIQ